MRNRMFGWLAMLGGSVLVASCKSSEGPTSHVQITPSTVTFATLQHTKKLAAQVIDASGNPVAGQTFTWATANALIASVDTGGTVTSQGNGSTTITVTSGSVQGQVTVSVAQVATMVLISAGNGQVAPPSTQLATAITAKVADSGGTGIPGLTVNFAVATGGGSLAPGSAVTGAAGTASTVWTLGPSATAQTLTATSSSAGSVTFTATALPTTASGFQILVDNIGPAMSPAVKAAFDSAATFWQTAITGDIPDVSNFSEAAGDCGPGTPAIGPITVDDVIILAKVDSIDGPGKILGQAGPCFIRITGGTVASFPIVGVMTFDSADLSNLVGAGQLTMVIKHEMAHVLGFGTYWPATIGPYTGAGCLQNPTSAGTHVDTYYNCARGLAVFDSIGGTSYTGDSLGAHKVPVENCVGVSNCGAGTYNAHWRESTFFNELMTGFLNNGVVNPASVLSLAQMQDLGYTVSLAAAESYSRTFTTPPAAFMTVGTAASQLSLENDIARIPWRAVDNHGRLLAVIRPR